MTADSAFLDVLDGLRARGEPFALATVVRTVSMTAAKAGARAVIGADGSISAGLDLGSATPEEIALSIVAVRRHGQVARHAGAAVSADGP